MNLGIYGNLLLENLQISKNFLCISRISPARLDDESCPGTCSYLVLELNDHKVS